MMRYLMGPEAERHAHGSAAPPPRWFGGRFILSFERGFERLRMSYGGLLAWALEHRRGVVIGFLVFVVGSLSLLPLVGRDFFPTVDAGLIKLHVRGVPGTRIEETPAFTSGLWSVRLPRGQHRVEVLADSAAYVILDTASLYSSTLIVIFGSVATGVMALFYLAILSRRAFKRAVGGKSAP